MKIRSSYKGSVSKLKGIYYEPSRRKPWRVMVYLKSRKMFHIGYFKTEQDAEKALKKSLNHL